MPASRVLYRRQVKVVDPRYAVTDQPLETFDIFEKKSSWIYGMPSEPSCSKSLRTLDNIQHFEQENGGLALSYVCMCRIFLCILRTCLRPTYIYYKKDLAFNYYEPGKGAITEQEQRSLTNVHRKYYFGVSRKVL